MQCHLCDKKFEYNTDLSEHHDIHHKYFTCRVCGKGFGPGGAAPETNRDSHVWKKHSKNERIRASLRQQNNRKNSKISKAKNKLLTSLNKSDNYLMEINRILFNVRESTKNMKMKLNIESKYMITK